MSNDDIRLRVSIDGPTTYDTVAQVHDYLESKGLDFAFSIPRAPKDKGVGPKPEPTPSELAHAAMLRAIEDGDAFNARQFMELASNLRY